MANDPITLARRELAAQLARELENRLANLDAFGRACPCHNAEARAFLVRLREVAGDPAPAVAVAGAARARYTRR